MIVLTTSLPLGYLPAPKVGKGIGINHTRSALASYSWLVLSVSISGLHSPGCLALAPGPGGLDRDTQQHQHQRASHLSNHHHTHRGLTTSISTVIQFYSLRLPEVSLCSVKQLVVSLFGVLAPGPGGLG